MLPQQPLDRALRNAMREDERVTHALAYGSVPQGTADAFSDLEYYLYLHSQDADTFDARAFLAPHADVLHEVENEFGARNFVVRGLVRIELHCVPNSRLSDILQWPAEHIVPHAMLVKDRNGELHALLENLTARPAAEPAREGPLILARLLNWLVFGGNVLARGERIRALELLWWIQSGLLRLARLSERSTQHWLNPRRLVEWELGSDSLARFASTVGPLEELEHAYRQAWKWTKDLAFSLSLSIDDVLRAELEVRWYTLPDE